MLHKHPLASVFHTAGWLEALARTYGYRPFAVTTDENGPLGSAVPFCEITSWGSNKLVSLPFTDHCDLLVRTALERDCYLEALRSEVDSGRWRSVELRPRRPTRDGTESEVVQDVPLEKQPTRPPLNQRGYCFHSVDLSASLPEVFARFHRSNTQRAIRRAEREELSYETGRSDGLLESFYALLRLTRRRHGLPPQPVAWFRNLAACLGDAVTIHIASKNGRPVAAILTLRFKRTMVYKYGGSDAEYHRLGGMPFLQWRAMEEAKAAGCVEFDLGRSDWDQPGLLAFKDHLGAARSTLEYYSYPAARACGRSRVLTRAAGQVISRLPDFALDFTGRILYRHLG